MARSSESLSSAIAPVVEQLWQRQGFRLEHLGGDASSRLYHRVCELGGSRTLMLMELGADPLRSEEIAGDQQPTELPFYQLQQLLSKLGLPVPDIYRYLREERLLLLEDLGDETLERVVASAPPSVVEPLYRQAVELLVDLQQRTSTASPDAICFQRRFDRTLLRWELDHFREYLLEADRGVVLTRAEREQLDHQFDSLAGALAALPTVWVHRDYQSRNLMVQRQRALTRLRVIDFQDALLGPLPYDLVGLLRDSYVELPPELVCSLLEHYRACTKMISVSSQPLEHMFWLQTVQRKLKDAGRFVFIDRVKGNSSFLSHIPLSLKYVAVAFGRLPQLEPLAELLSRHVPELQPSVG